MIWHSVRSLPPLSIINQQEDITMAVHGAHLRDTPKKELVSDDVRWVMVDRAEMVPIPTLICTAVVER